MRVVPIDPALAILLAACGNADAETSPRSIAIYGSAFGDIVEVDPATGHTTVLIDHESSTALPGVAPCPDASRFLYDGTQEDHEQGIWAAECEGSDPREVVPPSVLQPGWVEWSPDGTHFATVPPDGSGVN